jgi:hypothetical protein
MNNPVLISTTVTVPQSSDVWGLSITGTPIPAASPKPATPPPVPAQRGVPKRSLPIQYAAAVLKGQDDTLASIAPSFKSDKARIRKQQLKKQEDSWVLESSEFAPCTTGEEVLPVADDIVSRINRILALYCSFTPSLSVECISWTSAEGELLRTVRGSISTDIVSSKGLAELKGVCGTQPLGSAVFEAMAQDSAVEEGLSLHGDSGLSWSQIYDIIDFVGGIDHIAEARYATKEKTGIVRRTANHYRHLGNPKEYPLPPKPPTLADASDFIRSLLKSWISSRI